MRRHGWALGVGAGVGVALLVLLGTLQVQWLDQVAETIAAQKRATLYQRGRAIAADLERELTRAFFWFNLEGRGELSSIEALLQARFASWHRAGHHDALVTSVWLVEAADVEETATTQLRRLMPDGLLRAADWPAALAPARAHLRDGFVLPGPLSTNDPEGPWLAIPTHLGPGAPDDSRSTVLLHLDGRYLAATLLPALARAHLRDAAAGGDDQDEIVVTLEDGDARTLSAWPIGAHPVTSREHAPIVILGVRPDLITAGLLAGMQPAPRWPNQANGPNEPAFGPDDRVTVHHRIDAGLPGFVVGFGPGTAVFPPGLSAIPPGAAGAPGVPGFAGRFRAGVGVPPPIPAWRLALAFRAGPVDDVVTGLRRRKVALGFSILGLLGGAIAMLTVAVRRAHTLADRQRQFMASVSHELRTPVAVIAAAAENLRDGIVEGATQIREYGTMIHAESKRLHAMVDHALRLAAGGPAGDGREEQPSLSRIDLGAVVAAAVESFAQELRARGGRIERRQPSAPVMVTGDRESLRQAIENVVGNAVKYGGDPPRISLALREVQTTAGAQAEIEVADHGMGIPPDEVDQIFEPFFRGREPLSRQIRGTGLGLALVARVVRAHGGTIAVTSSPAEGSTFILRLPSAYEADVDVDAGTGSRK
jgi:two-component system sensor histidine kinase SenX3